MLSFLIAFLAIKIDATDFNVIDSLNAIQVITPNYILKIDKSNFGYSFFKTDHNIWLEKCKGSGLEYLNSPVNFVSFRKIIGDTIIIDVSNELGIKAVVKLEPAFNFLKMGVRLEGDGSIQGSIIARTGGLAPAYGLADHAARRKDRSTEVSGFSSNSFGALSDGKPSRLVSNFVIFPKQHLACVNIEPNKKVVKVSEQELVQGITYGSAMKSLYYFFGTPKQIYKSYLDVRNKEGYKVYTPKYEWFGVGWEAWGALAWNTNAQTVKENVKHYLDLGFPLDWIVIGSGFWAKDSAALLSTTSFGLWDTNFYTQPDSLIEYFHNKGLKFILGLRIAFIPNGPNTLEGIEKGYFIQKEGRPRLFKVSFPKPECYFLDAENSEAVHWYLQLCKRWTDFGVDGFKEDLFGYEIEDLPDTKLNKINEALMDSGIYLMGRNGYLGSPMDLHRFEDFNYNQNQDRGPINGLAFAYSGFPYVYPDIVCGKGLHNMEFGDLSGEKLKAYFVRNAWYASLNPSMSFGYGVWNLKDDHITNIVIKAAQMHHKLHPYIYSAAVKTALTGYPYTLTPLPIAFPNDDQTYYRENGNIRGYQWLINETLMACPLYGDDYLKARTRDVYIPEGTWIDYDNGKVYYGPQLLKDFEIPIEKTPLFVGGTGFVVELKNNQLKARVYPTGFKGKTFFYDKNKEESVISIDIKKTKNLKVKDLTTGEIIKGEEIAFAFEFDFVPGHNYEIW